MAFKQGGVDRMDGGPNFGDRRWEQPLVWWFSFSVISLTFKQTHIWSIGGPFEWLALITALVILITKLRVRETLNDPFLVTACVVFFTLALGGLWWGVFAPDSLSVRDSLAYSFAFLIVFSFIILANGKGTFPLYTLSAVIALYFIVIIPISLAPSPVQGHLWYHNFRLQGLSDNPNQIGFLATIGISFTIIHDYFHREHRSRSMVIGLICLFGGLMSVSSAFMVAIFVLAGVIAFFLAVAAYRYIAGNRDALDYIPRSIFPVVIVGLAWILVPASGLFDDEASVRTTSSLSSGSSSSSSSTRPGSANYQESVLSAIKSDEQTGSIRMTLWRNGVEAALRSPIVGLGPGAHVYLEETGGYHEAHNSVIDIFIVSGVVGVLAVIASIGLILRNAWRNEHLMLVMVVCGIIFSFSMFHYIGRQPLFWIAIFALAVAALAPPEAGRSGFRQSNR